MYKKPECDYENYDGTKYEEDKATYRKNVGGGPKSRTHWVLGAGMSDDEWDGIFGKK